MALGPWDLAARIDAMFTALEGDPRVDVLLAERQPPLTEDALERIHELLGWELDPRFTDFFRIHNGLRVFWVDASFEPEEDRASLEPWEHWLLASEQEVPCGSIQVPELHEVLFGESHFDSHSSGYGESFVRALGGWDMTMFYERLRGIDDYEHDPDMSFYLPGMILDPLYPDPVVIFSDDYTASVDSSSPMLAREYLDMIIATLGIERVRKERMRYTSDATTQLFLAPHDWLRDFPDASQVLDALFMPGTNRGITRRIQGIIEVEGRPVQTSAYASYVDTTLHDSKRIPDDSPSARVIRKEDFKWDHWVMGGRAVFERFPDNHPMVIPTLDPRHYRVDNPLTPAYMPVSTLRTLIGAPVKFSAPRQTPAVQVACLIGIDTTSNRADPRLWYYWASFSDSHDGTWHFGSYSYHHVLMSELEWIGLALPDFHHDW